MDRVCRFYSALGFRFVQERHGSGPVHSTSGTGGLVFEIYPREPQEPATIATRIGFVVESLDAALAAVRSAEGAVLCEPRARPPGRHAVVSDPEGHRVELLER